MLQCQTRWNGLGLWNALKGGAGLTFYYYSASLSLSAFCGEREGEKDTYIERYKVIKL
jgi:hypothetical protein